MTHNDHVRPSDTLRREILAKPSIDEFDLKGYFATLIMDFFQRRFHQQVQPDVLQYIKQMAEQEGYGFVKLLLEAGYRYDAAIAASDWFLSLE